jgi:hypothetical protein
MITADAGVSKAQNSAIWALTFFYQSDCSKRARIQIEYYKSCYNT